MDPLLQLLLAQLLELLLVLVLVLVEADAGATAGIGKSPPLMYVYITSVRVPR